MIFFMLTNILTETTELVYVGPGAAKVVETAFEEAAAGKVLADQRGILCLPGVVSRKKQFVPSVLNALQQ